VHLILFPIAAGMMISLVNTGAILSWQKLQTCRRAAALMLFIAYQIAVSPFRGSTGCGAQARCRCRWFAFWHAGHRLMDWRSCLGGVDHIPKSRSSCSACRNRSGKSYAVRDFARQQTIRSRGLLDLTFPAA
jgi:hypothetical protein